MFFIKREKYPDDVVENVLEILIDLIKELIGESDDHSSNSSQ